MSEQQPQVTSTDFTREAERARPTLWTEFACFLRHSKKWWLVPIIVLLGGVGVLMLVGGSSVAPFIYTLF